MVGRLRGGRLAVLGGESASEWPGLVQPLCQELGIFCSLKGDGYGPSDQTPFYAAGVPVLHFFTGSHQEYHKPADDAHLINAAGGARISTLVGRLLADLGERPEPLSYQQVPAPAPQGDSRSYGSYLGTIPDYVGAEDDLKGVLLAGVREGGPAQLAGLRRGDRLIGLGGVEVGDIHDFTFILRRAKPDQETTAIVLRKGERLEFLVVYGSRSRMR